MNSAQFATIVPQLPNLESISMHEDDDLSDLSAASSHEKLRYIWGFTGDTPPEGFRFANEDESSWGRSQG